MNTDEFSASEKRIYDSFRNISDVVEFGLSPNEKVFGIGGYLIALKHPKIISDEISDYARLVSEHAPSIAYSSENIQTIISDFSVGRDFSPDNKVLDSLCSIVSASLANHDFSAPEINFGAWLYKRSAVIIPGIPDKNFMELSNAVVGEGNEAGYNIKSPQSAHITVIRMTGEKPAEELAQFYALMEFAPIIGKSRAESVDVGYFSLDKSGFSFTPYEKFRF